MASSLASPPLIELKDYRIECSEANHLGQGTFGTTWKGKHRIHEEQEVAVKKVISDFLEKEREGEFARMLRSKEHENVVKFYDVETQENFVYLVLELCDMNLNTFFMTAASGVPISRCVRFMGEMAAGVRHLHDLTICHRDISPNNILIKDDKVKIADLGLGRLMPETSNTPYSYTGNRGTPGWQAPEIPEKGKGVYNLQVDIFSLALLFHAMVRHEVGRDLIPRVENHVALGGWMRAIGGDGHQVTVPDLGRPGDDELVKDILNLIGEMLRYQPDDRIKIATVCERINGMQG